MNINRCEEGDMADRNNVGSTQRGGLGGSAGGRIVPLSDMGDYEIAEGFPDVRGWAVTERGGKKVGQVHELLVDTSAMQVRYVDVALERDFAGAGGDRHVLIPAGSVTLDQSRDDVVLDGIGASQLASLTPYTHSGVTREYETGLLRGLGLGSSAGSADADFYRSQHFDEQRLFAGRQRNATTRREEQAVTRAEEELAVGKRQVQAGEVGVRKTVETQRVREQVPVTREEVEIERRPLQAGADMRGVDIREDEIRVPVMAEEVVAEKRLVPKEQIIIRKRGVTQQQAVEADIRKERVEVEDRTRGRSTRSDEQTRRL
jgi:uncharacterized protein (TIGR02271 family)